MPKFAPDKKSFLNIFHSPIEAIPKSPPKKHCSNPVAEAAAKKKEKDKEKESTMKRKMCSKSEGKMTDEEIVL